MPDELFASRTGIKGVSCKCSNASFWYDDNVVLFHLLIVAQRMNSVEKMMKALSTQLKNALIYIVHNFKASGHRHRLAVFQLHRLALLQLHPLALLQLHPPGLLQLHPLALLQLHPPALCCCILQIFFSCIL